MARYAPQGRLQTKGDANARRLKALAKAFGLTPTVVARRVGCSRSYVSRILSAKDAFVGNEEFWRSAEAKLPDLVASRGQQFFRIAPRNVRSIERALADAGE